VTWWIESVEIDEPGWQEAIAVRVRAAPARPADQGG